MTRSASVRRFADLAMYVLLCVIWGSTWLVIKVGYGGLGPFNVASLRFFLAALVLAPLVRVLGARWPRGTVEWSLVFFVGFVLFGLDFGLIYWGEQFLDSGLTAILFATLPLITIVLAHFYLTGDPITPRKFAGTLLSFFGVIALFSENVRIDPAKVVPMAAIVLSAACASAAGVATKRHGSALHPAALNAPAMAVGAVALLVSSVVAGHGYRLPATVVGWGAIAYLALAGSVVTFLAYFTLLKTWSVTSLSFISVFTPAMALMLGFLVLDERPTLLAALGALLILAGVMTALSKPA